MSSLVESRHDGDAAAADCSTRSATMSGGRHGRLPQTSRSLAGAGPATSRVGASSSATEMDAAVQQRGLPSSSLFHSDPSSSSRLSLKPDFADHNDVDQPDSDAKFAVTAPDNVVHVELRTGSRDTGSRNLPATDRTAAGEVRSLSADAAPNSVEARCVDSDLRSRDDRYLPPGGVSDAAINKESPDNWNVDSDERKTVFGVEPSEQIVNARCQSYVGDSAQRCSGKQTKNGYSSTGRNLTPRLKLSECRNMDESSSGSQYGSADVKLETYVDESQTNSSEDEVDSVTSSHFRPSTTTSSSLLDGIQNNHVISTCSDSQYKSYSGAGSSDIISAKIAAGA